jgi:O-antigen/teichoic acid export membrane protein
MRDPLLSKIIGGTASIGMGRAAKLILGLVGTILVVRHLAAEVFGTFVLIQVSAGFLSQFSGLGLEMSVARSLAAMRDEDRKSEIVNTAVAFRMIVILLVSLLVLGVSIIFPDLIPLPGFSRPGMVVAIFFALQSFANVEKALLQGHFAFSKIGLGEFVSSMSYFGLLVLLVVLLDHGLVGLIYARVLSSLLGCLLMLSWIPGRRRVSLDVGALRGLLRFGLPLQINDALTYLFTRVDTIMIATLLGPAEIAYYEIARKIPDALAGLFGAFRTVYYAAMSDLFGREERRDASEVVNHSTRLFAALSLVGAVVALALGKDLIRILFSDTYSVSWESFVILMTALCASLIGDTLGTALVAGGESSKPAVINTVHAAVSLAANWLLVPVLGIAGAAVASLAGSIATNPLNVLYLKKTGLKVDVLAYVRPVLAFGLYVPVVLVMQQGSAFTRAMGVVGFIIPCLLFAAITRQDIAALGVEASAIWLRLAARQESGGARL